MKTLIITCLVWIVSAMPDVKQPNIMVIITDDQAMDDFYVMEKTKELIADRGVTFVNSFCSNPTCCPSRASILTGQYQHNHGVVNNSMEGHCYDNFWKETKEPFVFSVYLQAAGYKTFYGGKYLNAYDSSDVPPGWDSWVAYAGGAYYNYTLSINGTYKHFKNKYANTVIESYSLEFLESMSRSSDPFLMFISPPAPHGPFTPEPKYDGVFEGLKAPRDPSFNIVPEGKHWIARQGPAPLPDSIIAQIDENYAKRLETLLSVDDLVAKLVHKLDKMHKLDDTVIIFTSDNGVHGGQFSLLYDNRMPYEFDIRVNLCARGPHIKPGSEISTLVGNIDLAPTILQLANVPIPAQMDGKSFVPLLEKEKDKIQPRAFLIENQGEADPNSIDEECVDKRDDPNLAGCHVDTDCKCVDARNNTYNCLRYISKCNDTVYCKFNDSEHFVEYYDLKSDYYQLNNLACSLSDSLREVYEKALQSLVQCAGSNCNDVTL